MAETQRSDHGVRIRPRQEPPQPPRRVHRVRQGTRLSTSQHRRLCQGPHRVSFILTTVFLQLCTIFDSLNSQAVTADILFPNFVLI